MSNQEFSNEFDTLLNSYSTSAEFGGEHKFDIVIDEYEKSVLLTKAQEQIVLEIYNGKNLTGDNFEGTEEDRRYIDYLIKTSEITEKVEGNIGLSDNSVFFKLPEDLWFITYEGVILGGENAGCHNGKPADVVPIKQDEYHKTIRNPFRGPSYRRALRLDYGKGIVEIISDYEITKYIVKYLSKPSPIVLVHLGSLSIDGTNKETECKLNSALHRVILERAVRLALVSKTQVSSSSK